MRVVTLKTGTSVWKDAVDLKTIACCLILVMGLNACDRGGDSQSQKTSPNSTHPVTKLERVGVAKENSDSLLLVCLFTRTDCPISNSYAPEVRRIHEKFSPRNVGFYLVYSDPDEGREVIEKHVKEYSYPFPALRDPRHELVKMTGAKVTPEAAVFDKHGKLLYRGRIDDRYVDFGKARAAATQRDLENALEAILAGKPAPPAGGPAIGCMIPDLK
jgi:hypothetical protein